VGRAWIIGGDIAATEIVRLVQSVRSSAVSDDALVFLPGDFLVGGLDVGGGEDLRAATATLRSLGVGAVIARSFNQRFYHGAIERGLPALVIEEAAAIKQGDRLRVDIEEHKIANQSSGDRYIIRNLYDDGLDVLRAGGLAAYRVHQARRNGGTHQ
jgi:3-isopropylmalate dehydratase small subunit